MYQQYRQLPFVIFHFHLFSLLSVAFLFSPACPVSRLIFVSLVSRLRLPTSPAPHRTLSVLVLDVTGRLGASVSPDARSRRMIPTVMALYRHSLIFMEPVLGLPISRRISVAQKLSRLAAGPARGWWSAGWSADELQRSRGGGRPQRGNRPTPTLQLTGPGHQQKPIEVPLAPLDVMRRQL